MSTTSAVIAPIRGSLHLNDSRRYEAPRRTLTDIGIAGIVLTLFDTILGTRDRVLIRDSSAALSEIEVLPTRYRTAAHAVLAWGAKRGIILNELIRAKQGVATSIIQMRRHSPFGRGRIRIANELRAKYPPVTPDGQLRQGHLQSLEVLGDEIGKSIGPGTVRRLSAFAPSRIEIRRHDEPWYTPWANRAAYIRLHADGFTIEQISIAASIERAPATTMIVGVLEDFFETGTEGVVWSVYDDDERGYDGLHTIQEGDHLTIMDQLGHRIWAGIIRCDRKSGYRKYPGNPQFGQPCALGHWIHWTQKGFKPDDWARFFIRPKRDQLRAILRKKPMPTNS